MEFVTLVKCRPLVLVTNDHCKTQYQTHFAVLAFNEEPFPRAYLDSMRAQHVAESFEDMSTNFASQWRVSHTNGASRWCVRLRL